MCPVVDVGSGSRAGVSLFFYLDCTERGSLVSPNVDGGRRRLSPEFQRDCTAVVQRMAAHTYTLDSAAIRCIKLQGR